MIPSTARPDVSESHTNSWFISPSGLHCCPDGAQVPRSLTRKIVSYTLMEALNDTPQTQANWLLTNTSPQWFDPRQVAIGRCDGRVQVDGGNIARPFAIFGNHSYIKGLVKTTTQLKLKATTRHSDKRKGIAAVLATRQAKTSDASRTYTLRTDVKEIREKLGLNQHDFAITFGIPLATLQNWEQGRRKPDVAVCVLLHLIASDPEGVAAEVSRLKVSEPA